ncbi:unnamed protein product [Chrysoparadoxa australica]
MSTGFGICGHKNHYSSKVKYGNYVEDLIGAELADKRLKSGPPALGTTTQQDDMIPPAAMVDRTNHPKVPFMTPQAIKEKNCNGLPFELLVGHVSDAGHEAELRKERFLTATQSTYGHMSGGDLSHRLLGTQKIRAREGALVREQRGLDSYETTYRTMLAKTK